MAKEKEKTPDRDKDKDKKKPDTFGDGGSVTQAPGSPGAATVESVPTTAQTPPPVTAVETVVEAVPVSAPTAVLAGGPTAPTVPTPPGTNPVPAAGVPSSDAFIKSYNVSRFIHDMWQQLYNGLQAGATASFNTHKDVFRIKYIDTKGPRK